jgi:flagellar protein FliJ
MTWSQSLIKLATFEVEVMQKRLADIVGRRVQAEAALAALIAEGDREAASQGRDAGTDWMHIGFLDGLRRRKADIQARIDALLIEEAGARDALAEAFEAQKKYEQVAENARQLDRRETARRETAALDELARRRGAN